MLNRLRSLICSRRQPAAGDQPLDGSLRYWMGRAGQTEYPRRHYEEEDRAREALKVVEEHTMTSYERMMTLWQQVRYLDRAGIEGCLVECGTWRGGAMGMMALAHLASGPPTRTLHLFDSFEGLPEPDGVKDSDMAVEYSKGQASGAMKPIGRCVGTLEGNRQLLGEIIGYPEALTLYHVGWFQDTVAPAVPEVGRIALLRLDGDWYESTQVCIEAFGPLVSSGGIVVVDDYGKWAGCRQAVDEFLAKLSRPVFLSYIDASGRYYVVP
jgi:O-methyltransferase